jgi:hypothetical protein
LATCMLIGKCCHCLLIRYTLGIKIDCSNLEIGILIRY